MATIPISKFTHRIQAAVIGAAIGVFFCYFICHKEERAIFERIVNKKPFGQLIVSPKDKSRFPLTHIIDLEGNVGSSPGLRRKSYSTIGQDGFGTSLEFAYVPEEMSTFGDPILIRFKTSTGIVSDFIVRNGEFRTIYEDKDFKLDYTEKPKQGDR